MLADALVGGGQCRCLRQLGEGPHRGQAARHLGQAWRALRQHRVDLLRGVALLAQRAGEAVVEEAQQFVERPCRASAACASPIAISCVQVERQVRLDQHPDHAQRMAAQCERILVAGGCLADAEQADQRLELVGQRDDDAGAVARQRIAGKARLVVILDRERDLVGQAVVARVVAAHDALQLGKLADHVGQQVGLGELRRLFGLRGQRRTAELLADGARDRAHPAARARPGCRACRGRPPCRARAARSASERLRSWSKKNLASARRGRTTRSLPSITRDGSAGEMLLTTRNWLVSRPSASSSGKYFWFAFIVRMRHSCGTARNSASKRHSSTLGRSTSAVTSSSSAGSSIGVRPSGDGGGPQLAQDVAAPMLEVGDHRTLLERAASA